MTMHIENPIALEGTLSTSNPQRRCYEDLVEGEQFIYTRRVGWFAVILATLVTRDFNPKHWNFFFARRKGYLGTVAPATLIIGLLSSAVGYHLLVPNSSFTKLDASFRKPLCVGEVAEVLFRIEKKRFPLVTITAQVINGNGEEVAKGRGAAYVPTRAEFSSVD